VQELIVREGSTSKPLLTSFTEQKLDTNREDVVHWMWAMQHGMHIKLSPKQGKESWRDVGESVLAALCDVLFLPALVQKQIHEQTEKAAYAKYKQAELRFREKHAASLVSLPHILEKQSVPNLSIGQQGKVCKNT
jgi:hypothetical protein